MKTGTGKDGAESILGSAALLAASPTCAHCSSQQRHSCENPSPPLFMLWLCQSLNAFVKETFPSVEESGCHREEFDSKAVSAPQMHAPQAAPRPGCKAWLCPDTQHLFPVSSVALESLKNHPFFFPPDFSIPSAKNPWGQCFWNTMLRVSTAHMSIRRRWGDTGIAMGDRGELGEPNWMQPHLHPCLGQ